MKLSKRKEALLAQLQDIEREMVRLQKFRKARRRIDKKGTITISRESRKRSARSKRR